MEQTYMIKSTISISLIIAVVFGSTILPTSGNAQSAETKDVFKVNVSLSGITSSTKDILIIVNVKDMTRSKLFNAESPKLEGTNKVNYTLTFPGSLVDEGDKYTVCVMTVKNFKLQCDHANNSHLNRAELVDINLPSSDMDKKGKIQTIRTPKSITVITFRIIILFSHRNEFFQIVRRLSMIG